MREPTNYTEVAKRLVVLLDESNGNHNIDRDFMPTEGQEASCIVDIAITYKELGEYIRLAHDIKES